MPHQQIRTNPAKSPRDVDGVLEFIASRELSLIGVGGSDHEFDGRIGLMFSDDVDLEVLRDGIREQGFAQTDIYGEPEGLHLDYAVHEAGGLAAAVLRGRRHHPGGVVKDIAVGVEKVLFHVDPSGDVIRDSAGYPTTDDGGDPLEAHPVQIYFLITPSRGGDGRVSGDN